MRKSAIERFEEKYIPEPNSGCWLWTAAILWNGYGQFWNGDRLSPAHRFSYELHKGQIPQGMVIDHLCRVRSCVNPDHLEVVTNRQNIMRGTGLTAQNARKTHCIRGHALSGDNLTMNSATSKRSCKTCMRALWANYNPKKSVTGMAQPPAQKPSDR